MLCAVILQHITSGIKRAVIIVHVMSVDIALGVCGCMVLCTTSLDVVIPWQWYVTLPLATWAVYILDRLLDIRRTTVEDSTYRHGMVRMYQRPLSMLALVLLIISGALALTTPNVSNMWPLPAIASVAVVFHFWIQRLPSTAFTGILKDVNVIATYTIGTVAIPALHMPTPVTALPIASAIALATTAIVCVESLADLPTDIAASKPSIAQALPPFATPAIAAIAALGIAALATWIHPIMYAQAVAIAALPMVFRSTVALPIKRAYAECILALPLLLLI